VMKRGKNEGRGQIALLPRCFWNWLRFCQTHTASRRRSPARLQVAGRARNRAHSPHTLPNEPRGRVVMTTWHSKESLSEALWFFANCVEPDVGFEADCKDWVALSAKNESWAQQIHANLIDDGERK
jgi:hypothetical protein